MTIDNAKETIIAWSHIVQERACGSIKEREETENECDEILTLLDAYTEMLDRRFK